MKTTGHLILTIAFILLFTSCHKEQKKARVLNGKWKLVSLYDVDAQINVTNAIPEGVELEFRKDGQTNGDIRIVSNPKFGAEKDVYEMQTHFYCDTYEVFSGGDSINFHGFKSYIAKLNQSDLETHGQLPGCYYGYVDPLKNYTAKFTATKKHWPWP